MTPPLEDPDLPVLISAALEMRDSGVEPPYEEICRDRPDLIEHVRKSVEFSEQLPEIARSEPTRVLGRRYRLDAQIGAGAMGVVYRATDKDLGRPVAIKILRAAVLGPEEASSRFAREAEAMAAIRHPGVATVHDRGRTPEGDTYLVMELLEGASLVALLERAEARGPAVHTEDTAWVAEAIGARELADRTLLRTSVRWIAELAAGLHAAHEAGVIHRDIKPSNVFIRQDGRAVLLDFGIASRLSHETITRDGGALGTPAYMAPETLDEGRLPQRAIDVYGLAATLYHLLTLKPPFSGTPSQVLARLVKRDPTPAYRLRPGLPRDLQAILDKAMARNPAARYRTAAELEADLVAFLEHRPVTARPVWAATRLLRRARRSPAFWAATSVALLAIGLTAGVQWRSSWVVARNAEFLEVWSRLTANTTLGSFANRKVALEGEFAATMEVLDRATELALTPLPARAYRAAFRLDHGDVRGSIADMRAIAAELGTAYARAVADRFAALPPDASSAEDVDLERLPAPATADDVLLAAYLSYRALDRDNATRLLGDPRLAESAAAEDLRLLLESRRVGIIKSDDERAYAAGRLYERVVRHEARIGRRTGQTAHVAAFALLMQARYRDCLEVAMDGIELAPWSYTLRINAGRAAKQLNRPRAALRILAEARDLRPSFSKPRRTRFYTCIDIGDLDQAAAILEALPPFDGNAQERYNRARMRGTLEGERALALYDAGKQQEAAAAAEVACEHFREARALAPLQPQPYYVVTESLANNDPDSVFPGLAVATAANPVVRAHILRLLAWMPDELDRTDTAALRAYLRSLARHAALAADTEPVDVTSNR